MDHLKQHASSAWAISARTEIIFGDLMRGVKVVFVDEELQETDQGEAMIAGSSLAAGYLNNSALTAKKFIWWNDERFYRTSDLARRRSDGQYVFMGGADSLVKNRGFLINLKTEVEPALLSFHSVRVAVAFKAQNERLVGCVQPATVDVEQLRLFLRERCDPFVVPDDLMAMDSFPLIVNGKTDRNAIKASSLSVYRRTRRRIYYKALVLIVTHMTHCAWGLPRLCTLDLNSSTESLPLSRWGGIL
jgi:acyl-coenzyme A synthetase/AMP-(fatty) acid ligase